MALLIKDMEEEMPKNYNIQTACKQIVTTGSHVAIGSSVAAGMKRYVTMVRVTCLVNSAAKGSRVLFSSASTSNAYTMTLASAASKINVSVCSNVGSAAARVVVPRKSVSVPEQPDTENPLFTIAASKWLIATLASAAGQSSTANVFVQYYDQ